MPVCLFNSACKVAYVDEILYVVISIFVIYFTTFLRNLHYIASNGRVIGEWRIGKDVEGSGHGLI
jgi:hypothetical protein